MYIITAVRSVKTRRGVIARQVPTFFLDKNAQGIVNKEQAERIARDILGDNVSICVLEAA